MTAKHTADWLDDREFYEVCQQYRHAQDYICADPNFPSVVQAFEQLKDYIRAKSAAPDLLAALEYVLETHIFTGNDGEEANKQARAALARATGKGE